MNRLRIFIIVLFSIIAHCSNVNAHIIDTLNFSINELETETIGDYTILSLPFFETTQKIGDPDPPITAETIQLMGLLDTNAGPDDIEAYFDGSTVYVCFHRSFGSVNITLYDPSNVMVYNNVVNTEIQQLVVIRLNSLTQGVYTLYLENTFGYSNGEFEYQ